MSRKRSTSKCCCREDRCGSENGFGGSWIILIIIIFIFLGGSNRRGFC